MTNRIRPMSARITLLLCMVLAGTAPAAETGVVVKIRTDRDDALYSCGEKASFLVSVTDNGQGVTDGEVAITLTRDLAAKIGQQKLVLGNEPARLSETLSKPGFLNCEAAFTKEGKVYKASGAAAFDPTRIEPACTMPDDFDAFWQAGRAELAKLPLDVQLKPYPPTTNKVQESYRISFANLDNTRIYGYLHVPKNKPAPFPARVSVPFSGVVQKAFWFPPIGALHLDLRIHDLDPDDPPADLAKFDNYVSQGGPDREKYYFRRVILGLDRAIDYLAARPDFDGKHLVISGMSQGGGLSLILAGLNQHITAAETDRPAMCDHLGLAGTWPGLAHRGPKEWAAMSAYFDAVNFARKIKCPTLFHVGFLDTSCPPTSVYAAYNSVAAPKHIFNYPLFGHGGGQLPAMADFEKKWILGQLGLGPPVPFPGEEQ